MIYFAGAPNVIVFLYLLSTVISIVVGRYLVKFINKKDGFEPSKCDFVIWFVLPLIGGFFTLAAFIIVFIIEVDKTRLINNLKQLFYYLRIIQKK